MWLNTVAREAPITPLNIEICLGDDKVMLWSLFNGTDLITELYRTYETRQYRC